MTNDTLRSELAELRDTVHSGFARMDRYFELSQAQYLELRGELRGDVQGLRGDVQGLRAEVQELRTLLVALTDRVDRIEARLDSVDKRLDGLENQVQQFRDWVALELADVRREIRLLRRSTEQPDVDLRRDIDALDARVSRLEQRRDDTAT